MLKAVSVMLTALAQIFLVLEANATQSSGLAALYVSVALVIGSVVWGKLFTDASKIVEEE